MEINDSLELVLRVATNFNLPNFVQLNQLGSDRNHVELTAIINKNLINKLNSESSHSPFLTKHGVYCVLKHKSRSASFFVNRINDLNSLGSLSWYLFEYKDIRFMNKKISPSAKSFFANIFNPNVFSLRVPTVYFIWKVYFRREKIDYPTAKEIADTYQKDRLEFMADFYASGIDDTELYGDTKNRNLYQVSDVLVSPLGLIELNSRSSVYKDSSVETLLALFFDLAVHFPNSVDKLNSLGRPLLEYLSTSVRLKHGTCSLFSLLAYVSYLKSKGVVDLGDVEDFDIEEWYRREWCSVFPASRLVSRIRDVSIQSKTLNLGIAANWDSNSGLTRNALMSVVAIESLGVDVQKINQQGYYIQGAGNNFSKENSILIHCNADDAVDVMLDIEANPLDSINRNYYGFYLWELEAVPPIHELGAVLVDKILTPTDFLAVAYQKVDGVTNVENIGKYIVLPEDTSLSKSISSILKSKYCFLTVFDAGSGVERKNPYALVKAYCEEFKEHEGAFLILKGGRPSSDHWGDPYNTYEKISSIAAERSDILLIEDYISDGDIQSLISGSSCIVSPHRGEGFGYLMAYAILKGKPLIYCSYTGVDAKFFSSSNCFPIDYKLQKLPFGKFFHDSSSAVWANVSVGDLRTKLRHVFDHKVNDSVCDNSIMDYFSVNSYGERLLTSMDKR